MPYATAHKVVQQKLTGITLQDKRLESIESSCTSEAQGHSRTHFIPPALACKLTVTGHDHKPVPLYWETGTYTYLQLRRCGPQTIETPLVRSSSFPAIHRTGIHRLCSLVTRRHFLNIAYQDDVIHQYCIITLHSKYSKDTGCFFRLLKFICLAEVSYLVTAYT